MYLSQKSNGDGYAFFSKLDLTDSATLHGYRREFLDHMRNGLHGDFDRGYFSAWADCMRILTRIETQPTPNRKREDAEKEKVETLKSDKSQATMANFFQK